MSKAAYLRFRDAVVQDGTLQAELVNTVKSQADLVAMAKRLGFDLEAGDLESRELTEEEMKHVAGGVGGIVASHKSWTPVLGHEKWIDVSGFEVFLRNFPK